MSSETVNKEETSSSKPETYKKNINCVHCNTCILRSDHGICKSEPSFELPTIKVKEETELITNWVTVTDMYAFDNVGFTLPYKGRKFLICGNCDMGPIGVCGEDDKTYMIALSRVLSN